MPLTGPYVKAYIGSDPGGAEGLRFAWEIDVGASGVIRMRGWPVSLVQA